MLNITATFDSVTLADDMDQSIIDIIDKPLDLLDDADKESLNLYFVSCSRHRYELNNAKYLDELMELTSE